MNRNRQHLVQILVMALTSKLYKLKKIIHGLGNASTMFDLIATDEDADETDTYLGL